MIPKKDKIIDWAKAIQKFEGWYQGSRSYRNNNPGNLRYSKYAIGYDKDNFAIFRNYTEGLDALCFQLKIAANGKSKVYKPTDTLVQFFEKYAPSNDGNHPETYAKAVAKDLGVTVDTQIKELLA